MWYKKFDSIPWEFDFKNFANFLKMRGWRLILKITQSVQLFTLIDFIYKIRGNHLFSCQPTQFQPPQNQFFGSFFLHSVFPRWLAPYRLVSKDVEFFRIFWSIWKVRRRMPTYSNAHANIFLVPRELVRVSYHFRWFLKLYKLSYSAIQMGVEIAKKSQSSTYSWFFDGWVFQ